MSEVPISNNCTKMKGKKCIHTLKVNDEHKSSYQSEHQTHNSNMPPK